MPSAKLHFLSKMENSRKLEYKKIYITGIKLEKTCKSSKVCLGSFYSLNLVHYYRSQTVAPQMVFYSQCTK